MNDFLVADSQGSGEERAMTAARSASPAAIVGRQGCCFLTFIASN
jgi:hypothetical protein